MAELDSFTVRVDGQGRLLIPIRLRKQAGIEADSEVLVFAEDGGLVVVNPRVALAQAQRIVSEALGSKQGSLVDELLAERRREAEQEEPLAGRPSRLRRSSPAPGPKETVDCEVSGEGSGGRKKSA